MSARTLRGAVAVAGIGETAYSTSGTESARSRGEARPHSHPARLRRRRHQPARDRRFASYSNDRNDPSRLAAALGLLELRFSNMQWGGGGGGGAAAVGNGAAAVATGLADCVAVFRALAQGQFARFGPGAQTAAVSGEQAFTFPYGLMSPAQRFAMRFLHDHGVGQEACRAIALASYHHAQANPRAVVHGRLLTAEMCDASRWIVERHARRPLRSPPPTASTSTSSVPCSRIDIRQAPSLPTGSVVR
jgi:acetyl-CoA acetyltransferase